MIIYFFETLKIILKGFFYVLNQEENIMIA
jgi:hypothetical protein